MSSHSLSQEIPLTQRLKIGLLHCRPILDTEPPGTPSWGSGSLLLPTFLGLSSLPSLGPLLLLSHLLLWLFPTSLFSYKDLSDCVIQDDIFVSESGINQQSPFCHVRQYIHIMWRPGIEHFWGGTYHDRF